MKYLLAADFHGNVGAYKRFKEVADEVKPDKIVLLGDLFDYTGPMPVENELSRIFFPILAVKGNCDDIGNFDKLCVGFRVDGFFEEWETRRAYFTHGHIYGRYALPPIIGENDVIFFGHYHAPEISRVGGVWRVCVGSMGRPRAGFPAAYCVFDDNKIVIKALQTGEVITEATI